MAWTVILKDEATETIASMNGEFDTSLRDNLEGFKLLRYLDPYGDTIFNRLQMDDLIQDLRQLKRLETNSRIDDVLLLAERCKEDIHTYLYFYGD
jgi:hypothetical protein